MAGVIGEVNPLAGIGLAIDPAHRGTAEHFGQHHEKWNGQLFHLKSKSIRGRA